MGRGKEKARGINTGMEEHDGRMKSIWKSTMGARGVYGRVRGAHVGIDQNLP